MRELNSAAPNRRLYSRLQAIKFALFAGSGLAVGASPALADSSTPTPPPLPQMSPGSQGLIKPNSVATPGTSYKLYSGLDFTPFSSSTGYYHTSYSGVYSTSNSNFFKVPLDLPQKAKITEVEFYTTHNVGSPSYFYLFTVYPANGNATFSIYTIFTNTSSSVVTVPLSGVSNSPEVDNTNFKYVLFWYPGDISANEVLYGARVGYTGGIGRFGA